jgi:hypothetical protein
VVTATAGSIFILGVSAGVVVMGAGAFSSPGGNFTFETTVSSVVTATVDDARAAASIFCRADILGLGSAVAGGS